MNIEPQPLPLETVELTPREHALLQTIRLLGEVLPDALEQVERQVWELVGQHAKGEWSDPACLQRALQFAALDPFLKRESDAVTHEYASALGDGLEDD